MTRRVRTRIGGVIVGLVLVGTACGSDGDSAGIAPAAEGLPTATADPTQSAIPDPTPADTETEVEAEAETEPETTLLYPDVLAADLTTDGDRIYRVSVTLSSPYDSPERYADAWRVLDPDGNELGVRELAHDHANEQPFTRTLAGVEIPEGITEVTLEGRDQVSGWGGKTITVAVPD